MKKQQIGKQYVLVLDVFNHDDVRVKVFQM